MSEVDNFNSLVGDAAPHAAAAAAAVATEESAQPPCVAAIAADASCLAAAALAAGPVASGGAEETPNCFSASPSHAYGPDPFNVADLAKWDWRAPVFDLEYVGIHLNDLLSYYCILRNANQKLLARSCKDDHCFGVCLEQNNLIFKLFYWRNLLLGILERFETSVTSHLNDIRKEISEDKVKFDKMNARMVEFQCPKPQFDSIEEVFKIYALKNKLADGMVKHLLALLPQRSLRDQIGKEFIAEVVERVPFPL
jgi:hypothetical protein